MTDYSELYELFKEDTLTTPYMYDLETEKESLTDLAEQLNAGDIFLDIGSHAGVYSCMALLQRAKVIAVEPSPGPRSHLESNLEEIGGEFEIIDKPVSNEEKEIKLAIDGSGGTGSTTTDSPRFDGKEYKQETEEFTSIAAKELVNEYEPDVMKIDVEGSEREIVASIPAEYYPEITYCELHWDTKEDTSNLLKQVGDFNVMEKRDSTWQTVTKK